MLTERLTSHHFHDTKTILHPAVFYRCLRKSANLTNIFWAFGSEKLHAQQFDPETTYFDILMKRISWPGMSNNKKEAIKRAFATFSRAIATIAHRKNKSATSLASFLWSLLITRRSRVVWYYRIKNKKSNSHFGEIRIQSRSSSNMTTLR